MKRPQITLSRRSFLFAVAAGGAAATAAVVTSQSRDAGPRGRVKAEARSAGYRLTDHVRNYYRTAKV
jgi:hypothetical protein